MPNFQSSFTKMLEWAARCSRATSRQRDREELVQPQIHELRARHPRGVAARLRPYIRYYRSEAPRDDQPPFPTTLFMVDTEEVAETYANTASRMPAMKLPILVSSREILSYRGILGRSWRPLWDGERTPLALRELGVYEWDKLRRRVRRQETR